jgi:uncharacterized protein (TIGR03067 family)
VDIPFSKGDVRQELKKLSGNWTLEFAENDGKKANEAQVKMVRLVLDGEKNTSLLDDKPISQGTQKLDPAKNPKTIDIEYTDGFYKGKTRLGIYELDGDTSSLKLCLAEPSRERPTAFASAPGSKITLQVWKRVAPAELPKTDAPAEPAKKQYSATQRTFVIEHLASKKDSAVNQH